MIVSKRELRIRQKEERRSRVLPLAKRSEIRAPVASGAAIRPNTSLRTWRVLAAASVLATGVFAYWPTLCELVATWAREPDYSHGFLILPLALYFLYSRRASFPGTTDPNQGAGDLILGLGLFIASLAMRYLSARYFLGFLDAWSMLPWTAGVVTMLFGRRAGWWSLPAIGFLWFMVPLPFSLEGTLSYPLQKIATKASCFALQTLGLPAFAEGNVIVVGDSRLEVAQACSGLRLFMGVLALSYAYAVLVKRSWWERMVVLAAAVPIALVANAARIVLTGVLFQLFTAKDARLLAHDAAGWAMIPLAAALFWVLLWYIDRLLPEEEVLDMAALIREADL